MDSVTPQINNPKDKNPPTNCPNCGGSRFWAELVTKDPWGRYSKVHLSRTKGIKFLTGPDKIYTLCVGLVCNECGYTEVYAEEPNKLLQH